MMATYANTYKDARDEQKLERLTGAVAKVCVDIWGEAANAPDHALRAALVAYAGPRGTDFRRFAEEVSLYLMTAVPALADAGGYTDQSIYTGLSAIWTQYAGIMQAKGMISIPAAA